mmetsp:Transcript_7113/g.21226  ORF Transcript_7113/g.21226 Transcript_7113/m.21226 type:complete len:316 (-) Transcript_7113:512-1459(-)
MVDRVLILRVQPLTAFVSGLSSKERGEPLCPEPSTTAWCCIPSSLYLQLLPAPRHFPFSNQNLTQLLSVVVCVLRYQLAPWQISIAISLKRARTTLMNMLLINFALANSGCSSLLAASPDCHIVFLGWPSGTIILLYQLKLLLQQLLKPPTRRHAAIRLCAINYLYPLLTLANVYDCVSPGIDVTRKAIRVPNWPDNVVTIFEMGVIFPVCIVWPHNKKSAATKRCALIILAREKFTTVSTQYTCVGMAEKPIALRIIGGYNIISNGVNATSLQNSSPVPCACANFHNRPMLPNALKSSFAWDSKANLMLQWVYH